MKLKTTVNFFIKNADIIIGIPNPREYTKSNEAPFNILPEVEAIINAEPKKAPTHGVKFIEKTIPNKNAENNPVILVFCLAPLLKSFIFINSK